MHRPSWPDTAHWLLELTHFPTDQAALKVLYLVATEKRKNRQNPTGKINSWKTILNTLTIHYNDRITAAAN